MKGIVHWNVNAHMAKMIMARCFKMLKCPFKMYFHALELNFPLAQGQ